MAAGTGKQDPLITELCDHRFSPLDLSLSFSRTFVLDRPSCATVDKLMRAVFSAGPSILCTAQTR